MTGRVAARLLAAALGCVLLAPVAGCSHSGGGSGPVTRRAIQAVLDQHGSAVRRHDRGAFLRALGTTPASRRFRTAQLQEYANLTRLPLVTWRYTLGQRAQDPGAQTAAARRFGSGATVYKVTLRFALRGIDTRPTSHQLYWTFARDADGLVVAVDDAALQSVGGASWRGPWDFGPLLTVTGRHSLVLGHPATGRALLQALAGTVDHAVPAVTAVWGSDWSRDVLVLVPASSAELQADLGTAAGETAPVVAVATSDGTDPVSGAVLGQRLVVDPARLRRLSAVGARIVLQHEVTHIADAAATTETTPTWLVEGLAEYVGNLGSGQPVREAASELAAAVRAGSVPRHLPSASAFTGASAAQAYQGAWLACRLIAARAGQAGLVRLYRLVGRDGAVAPGVATAQAVHAVLGEPLARFETQWRAYLRRKLG